MRTDFHQIYQTFTNLIEKNMTNICELNTKVDKYHSDPQFVILKLYTWETAVLKVAVLWTLERVIKVKLP